MAINPIKIQKPGSSGGAGKGGLVGGIAALLAAPFTGGASLGLLPAAMSAGSALGGVVDPSSSGASGAPVQPSDAASRRLAAQAKQPPTDIPHSQILEQSLHALNEAPQDLKDAYGEPIFKAYTMALQKEKGGLA